MSVYVNTLPHGQQVASGNFIAAYGEGALNPKDDHDKALIDSGAFIPKDSAKQGGK